MKAKHFVLTLVFLAILELSCSLWRSCIQNPIDLVFVLDGSGSVGFGRFGRFKSFVQKLILRLNVGKHGTKVAVIQLADVKETKFEFGINNYSDVRAMLQGVENIKYRYGRLQNTEIALRLAENEVFNGENTTDRSCAHNVVVLIAEGPSTTHPITDVLEEASHLKKSGVHLVTVGVGKRILSEEFQNELQLIASSPRHAFFTTDDELLDLVDHLDGKLCSNISSTSLGCSQTKKPSLAPLPARGVITSVLVQTTTIWMTSYVPVPATCKPSIAPAKSSSLPAMSTSSIVIVKQSELPTIAQTKEIKTKAKKITKKFSGKQLKCFQCNFDEDVAKEFSIDCKGQECAPNEIYCADAVLEHAGRKFVRKKCATSQFCNTTTLECVKNFQHSAEYTDCSVKCCTESFCNPYSNASYITVSVYMKFLTSSIVLLARLIVDKY